MAGEEDGTIWEDCTGSMQVSYSIAQGGGVWPSMISVDGTELNGTIIADDARALAEMLQRAADVCDKSTDAVYGLLMYSAGYFWRWWRDRKIVRDIEARIAAMREELRRAS